MWENVKKYKICVSISFIFILTACFGNEPAYYEGGFPELFTVSVNSLLGTYGRPTDNPWPASIVILAEDKFGRTLFRYGEGSFGVSEANLLIVQRIDDGYVYFYPHYNFISSSREFNWAFTDENINNLKKVNNWNRPLSDDSEFLRFPISRDFNNRGPVSAELLTDAYMEVFPEFTLRRNQNTIRTTSMIYFRSDDYGRSVYYVTGRIGEGVFVHYAVLFQPDHSFDLATGVLLIEDANNYQTELRLFMETNGWNTPFVSE